MKNNIEIYKDEIITLYEQGEKYQDIALKFNVSKSSIGRYLREWGYRRRTELTQQLSKRIIAQYQDGIAIKQLANTYHLSECTISNLLKHSQIHIKEFCEMNHKYTLNECYFDVIDSEEKAYILGLLYADGCNTDNNKIILSLQEDDKHILEQINVLLGSDRPLRCIRYSDKNLNWSNQYCLAISNKHMSKQLNTLGVTARKSLTLTYPKWMPDDLTNHFIRGYFDGDGSILSTEHRISLIGTEDFCLSVSGIINNKLNITPGIYDVKNKNINTKHLRISGRKQVKRFLDYLYNNSHIYIYRKHKLYLDKYFDSLYD